ncbi:sensor histidine kinase [Streptomyces sp. NPDC053048]|uniref:sensor histidine kinase n=1 Tax=Streptomyces sp. NPDC053048 TaxID=3365694 RepID=UPI0037D4D896
MITWLRSPARAVTWTRWLHLVIAMVLATVCAFVFPGLGTMNTPAAAWLLVVPLPLLTALAMLPGVRLSEGMQAQLLLFPRRRDDDFAPAPSASWEDRWRTALWLVLRYELGTVTAFLSVHAPTLAVRLLGSGTGSGRLLAPVVLALLLAFVVVAGALAARAARALLGPSAAARLAALEERTERLLEHSRLARELHDSVGHALTVAVVQAGAARAAGSPEFTARALAAIEETGRHALEDLERVLKVLREDATGLADRPSLTDAERLLSAARASGARVTAEVGGALETVPGPVSREGYRIVQEALTNAVRHAGPVDVRVRIAVHARELELDVRNPLAGAAAVVSGGGSGLRGIRERAALLGGRAETGEHEGSWRVRVLLPLGGPGHPLG